MDAIGIEVVNTSNADDVLQLFEFGEEDGVRTLQTPHTFNVSDIQVGVRYSGAHTIDASRHLVVDLLDVASPVARAGPDQVENEDHVITLNASYSSDNDPTFHLTGSFRWSFDEYGNQVVLNGAVVKYGFSVPGKFWVNLTVWDTAGNVGTDTVIIQVRDRTPPVIWFGGNVTVDEDEWYIFDASATTDNDPFFDFTTGTFLWSIDLVTEVLERDTATFGHAFPDPGNYSGSISVFDKAGNMALEDFWIHVLDITPPVIIGVSNATVFEPTDGLLDATACFDNVGIVSVQWTVTFINWTGGYDEHIELEGTTPSYPFDQLGTHTVSLVLTDAANNVNSTVITVVYDDVPTITLPGWAVSMVGQRLEVQLNISDIYFTDLQVTKVEGPDGANVHGLPLAPALVWTPEQQHAGSEVTIMVEVHDGFVSSQASIIVHVNPSRGELNHAPVISSEPPLSAKRDTPYIYPVDAVDQDDDLLGYLLLAGPASMSISQGGTVSWDPPFDHGTILVDVHMLVTDGKDTAEQSWTIRWREPPNASPQITFVLDSTEVMVREKFLVDLSVYVLDPEAFEVDSDDPNHMLVWDVGYDESIVALVSKDGLVFRFQALDEKGISALNFKASDPSGAYDTAVMDLVVKGRSSSPSDDGLGWMLWLALAVLIAAGIAGGAVAMRRRGHVPEPIDPGEVDAMEAFGPPPETTPADADALSTALVSEEPGELGTFVEMERAQGDRRDVGPSGAAIVIPVKSRVVPDTPEPEGRAFQLEGIAVLEANGSVMASTGKVEQIMGPYADSIEEVRKGLRGDGLALMEVQGRRVLLGLRSGIGAICILRGREDEAFRMGLREHLGELFKDRSTEGALGVVEDILASAGPSDTAEVVKGAWTTRLDVERTYQGSVVLLDVRLVNETERILNNVRLRLYRDEDALTIQSISPKMLMTSGRIAIGNVPPGKVHNVAISLVPEVCMASKVRLMVTYTDMEGRSVSVPSLSIAVNVECPYLEFAGDVDEENLLAVHETGLGFSGHRVFDHGMDVDMKELFDIAVRLVVEQGPMKVISLEDESLMRSEAWFVASGVGGEPTVMTRVSAHGVDHLLELFVTSDDGATATGLLTHLASELLDAVANEIPGKRVEKVRDAATLEDIAVWPSLLDYKIMDE